MAQIENELGFQQPTIKPRKSLSSVKADGVAQQRSADADDAEALRVEEDRQHDRRQERQAPKKRPPKPQEQDVDAPALDDDGDGDGLMADIDDHGGRDAARPGVRVSGRRAD